MSDCDRKEFEDIKSKACVRPSRLVETSHIVKHCPHVFSTRHSRSLCRSTSSEATPKGEPHARFV